MPISINGTGSITGLSAGGLPDASITADDIASNAVTTAKVNDAAITSVKVNDGSITYSKLSDSSTEADNVAKRTAKAWVNFNGTGTVAIRDDFNVSSITDNALGDYTVNYSSSLSNSNYVIAGAARSTVDNGCVFALDFNSSPSTSSCRVRTIHTANTFIDSAFVFFIALN